MSTWRRIRTPSRPLPDSPWQPAAEPPSTDRLAAAGHPRWFAALLARRGVEDAAAAAAFLKPSPDQLHDPFGLRGMEEAVGRLLAAGSRGESVAVVGDYDVDGLTSTALLLAALAACGIRAEAIVPHRLREGYGFQEVHVERARERGASVVLTADCGTTSHTAAAAALAAGIDVIVTDHHRPGAPLPAAVIQINPHRPECSYPFPHLSGVGLALKLALALAARCRRRFDLAAVVRIACLGTVADLVPLVGENRVIAALGLASMTETRSQGLRSLLRRAGVRPPLTAADVGFRVGPRLNAAGRLDTAERALELLLTRDVARADALAEELERWNRERQAAEARVVEAARQLLAARHPRPPLLVAWGADWHRGVLGIAAGRIARELQRPTLLLTVAGAEAVGSGRSLPGLDLHGFLEAWGPELLRFGGHSQAVGLTVAVERLEEMARAWEGAAAGWDEDLFRERHEYELHLGPEAVNPELLARLSALEPHGMGNPPPLLRLGPLEARGAPRIFGRGHVAIASRLPGGGSLRVLGWGWAERLGSLVARPFEALGHLERDRLSGGPVLRLVAARPAGAD